MMRLTFLLAISAIVLLDGCSKNSTVINFNCKVADTYINSNVPALISGNAQMSYNPLYSPPQLQLTMFGPNNQAVNIFWYNIDSPAAITHLALKTYNMPAFPLPPLTVAGLYAAPYSSGASYSTGGGNKLSGTVTLTKNTGVGGLMSGTFAFTALNTISPYDTVYITAGSFTDVPVPTQ